MSGKTKSADVPMRAGTEKSMFLRHMAIRLFLSLWALDSLFYDPLGKALVTLFVLGAIMSVLQVVFTSLQAWGRLRDEQNKARSIRELAEARRQAAAQELKRVQAESAAKYFDLKSDGAK